MRPVGFLAISCLLGSVALAAPGEVTGLAWCTGSKDCLQWNPLASAGYRVYRGHSRSVRCLANPAFDSCVLGAFATASTGASVTEEPGAGSFLWFLVGAVDETGEGPFGLSAAGPRQLDYDEACTPACSPAGSACSVSADCCSASCIAGTCQADCCVEIGGACTQAHDCCSGSCVQGSCAASGWSNGSFVTYGQNGWGGDPASSPAAALLAAQYDFLFPTGTEIGVPGPTGFSMTFTSLAAVLDYLPAFGGAGPLNSDLVDPTSSVSGVFGGYVFALFFDVVFDDTGDLGGSSPLSFGDLTLCGISTMPRFNNLTLRQFFYEVNGNLGGVPFTENIEDIANLTNDVTLSFQGGVPSQFALQHLYATACP